MEVSLRGRNIAITDRLNEYVTKKTAKLDRYLPTIDEAHMELSVEKTRSAQDRQVAQLTVRNRGAILRAEERDQDIFAAIDAVVDKMQRQISRYKERVYQRGERAAGEKPNSVILEEVADEAEAEAPVGSIVRTKRFLVSPMHPEEAVEQMELLGHDFFVFFNAETESINVLYRRKDGDYGLLQPELG
ncbi:MAG TPA: ribosome-associated translation inhibitor RaiA [Anaerolineae bacterium]|nr:ribosome-associated translation inhibitor RaiA [Anaerolineae bacterium]